MSEFGQFPNTDQARLIRLPRVMGLTGLRSTAIYSRVQQGTFPAPVKLGRASAWVEHEVHDWIEAKMAERESTS